MHDPDGVRVWVHYLVRTALPRYYLTFAGEPVVFLGFMDIDLSGIKKATDPEGRPPDD